MRILCRATEYQEKAARDSLEEHQISCIFGVRLLPNAVARATSAPYVRTLCRATKYQEKAPHDSLKEHQISCIFCVRLFPNSVARATSAPYVRALCRATKSQAKAPREPFEEHQREQHRDLTCELCAARPNIKNRLFATRSRNIRFPPYSAPGSVLF